MRNIKFVYQKCLLDKNFFKIDKNKIKRIYNPSPLRTETTNVCYYSTLRDAQGLGGRLRDARPVLEAGGARQLVLPAFFRPNRVLAILAFTAIILAP